MKIRSKFISYSIDSVIKANLEMQTIQRELIKLGFRNPSLETFKNKNFLDRYNTWNDEKKNSFLKLIGGSANYKKTKSFIESLNNGEKS
jgi:hypothetical protein